MTCLCRISGLVHTMCSPGRCTSLNRADVHTHSFITTSLLDDDNLLSCLLNYPAVDHEHPFVLDYQQIAAAQATDAQLLELLQQKPQQYAYRNMDNNVQLITYTSAPNADWKICIPSSKLQAIINWYHQAMNHTSSNRTYETISRHFYHPQLQTYVQRTSAPCATCQLYKTKEKGMVIYLPVKLSPFPGMRWPLTSLDPGRSAMPTEMT